MLLPHPSEPGLSELLAIQTEIVRALARGEAAASGAARLLELIGRLLPGSAAVLGAAKRERGEILASVGLSSSLEANLGLLLQTSSLFARLSSLPAPLFLADLEVSAFPDPAAARGAALAPLAALFREAGFAALWIFPARPGERAEGGLLIALAAKGEPSPAQRRFLLWAAEVAHSLLEAAALEAERRQDRQRLLRLGQFKGLLAGVAKLAATAETEEDLYSAVTDLIVRETGLKLAWIGAPDETGWFRVKAKAGPAVAYLDGIGLSIDPALPEGRGPAGRAWREGRAVIVPFLEAEPAVALWLERARRFGIAASATLLLRREGELSALLALYASEQDRFDEEFTGVLEDLAREVSQALSALDRKVRLERLEAFYNALLGVSETLIQSRSEAEMLGEVCTRVVQPRLFELAWIGRPNPAGEIEILSAAGAKSGLLRSLRLRLDDSPPSLAAEAWRSGQPVIHNDFLRDPTPRPSRALALEMDLEAVASFPLRRQGQPFALLNLISRRAGTFDPAVLALCQRLVALLEHGLAAFDFKNRLIEEERRQFHLARQDVLTGLNNRLFFEESLPHALARARRAGTRLAVGLLDIDDLKPVNDAWGHASGDGLLRRFAGRLRRLLRESDLLCRFGGDEFAFAIEGLRDPSELAAAVERLQQAVAEPFDLGDGCVITARFSLGVAIAPDDGNEPDLLLRRADAALYVAKSSKGRQDSWWCRWQQGLLEQAAPARLPEDPFGPEAAALLAEHGVPQQLDAADLIDTFLAQFARYPPFHALLRAVTAEERERRRQRLIQDAAALLDPATSRAVMSSLGEEMGRIHALTGADPTLLVQAAGAFQNLIAQKLAALPLRAAARHDVAAILNARIQEWAALQIEAHARTVETYRTADLFTSAESALLWVDAAQRVLDALATLPGLAGAAMMRPDLSGRFHAELIGDAVEGRLRQFLQSEIGHSPSLDPASAFGRGILGSAWRSRELQSCVNYALDPRVVPWREALLGIGVRSSLAVPILDDQGRTDLILVLFGLYPHQFESPWIRQFALGLSERFAALRRLKRAETAPVLPPETAKSWRAALLGGGFALHYQPVVSLRDGRVIKVEALARLTLPSGEIIPPAQFLPLLGESDLDQIFCLGLDQALADLLRWEQEGLRLAVALNLSPTTLLRSDLAALLRARLAAHRLPPERLYLELTEDEWLGRDVPRQHILNQLVGLGVHLSIDDLGAGYSSLQRLHDLPFRELKIDQGLVREIDRDPVKTLHLVGALVQMGEDLGLEVVVEGLENPGLVEAAAVLGAHAGQGFVFSPPLPADEIAAWAQRFQLRLEHPVPRSGLGAIAVHWTWTRRHRLAQSPPEVFLADDDACGLSRFIQERGLAGSTIDHIHASLRRIAVQEGLESPAFRRISAELVAALARFRSEP